MHPWYGLRSLAGLVPLILALACASPAGAQLADRYRPVTVTGEMLSAWSGRDSANFRLYAWNGSAFEPIPYQVDELVVRVFEALPQNGIPEHEELTFDFDGEEDGTLDGDDELVAMPWDFGLQAPSSAWSGEGEERYEIEIEDPLTLEKRWAYLFIDPAGPTSPADYVTGHSGPAGDFETDRYRIHYDDKWLLTEWRVKAGAGGDESDLIDRVKGRFGPPEDPLETEDGWNLSSSFLGAIDGPVRAAREVLGAASGLHTTHVDIAYARHAERTVNLRLHEATQVSFYFDLDPAVLPGDYHDHEHGPLLLDGDPHPHDEHALDWMLAATPSGSLFVDFRELTDFPSQEGQDGRIESYHRDDETFNDFSGDIAGAHGNFGARLWYLDDTNETPYTTQQLWIPLEADADPAGLDEPVLLDNPPSVSALLQQRSLGEPDDDADGIPNADDNCPGASNPDQLDADLDGVGDACDECPTDPLDDSDGDGSCDSDDLCNGFDDAADADGDGNPDGCDPCPADADDDSDGDGSCDSDDLCPGSDDAIDADADGTPDGCDPCPADTADDSDGDGRCDSDDACPGFDDAADADADGLPDACDACPRDAENDADGDGACADEDNCPNDANAGQEDGDADGRGDACDDCPDGGDDDADGVCDADDACPGFDDALDDDGDGAPNACDPCPVDAADDSDDDGSCDSEDLCPGFDDARDADADGIADGCDACPADAANDADGDGACADEDNCSGIANPGQEDADGDGRGDACDQCPANSGDDSDGDGTCDSDDLCPGFDDALDADADGTPDDCDACPVDAAGDSDADGSCDSDDLCPGFDDALDADADGAPDGCDSCPVDAAGDSDGDGSCDSDDLCPGFDDALDADADGTPDGCDSCPADAAGDSDGDGSCDSDDLCPGFDDALDADADGTPDGCDACPVDAAGDSDGDGICDSEDNCPSVANPRQEDADADGLGDACEAPPVTLFVSRSGDDLMLSWTEGIAPYRVLSSDSPDRASFTALDDALPVPGFTDPDAATDGRSLVFYLVD